MTLFFRRIYPNINQQISGKYSQSIVSTQDQGLHTSKMDFSCTTEKQNSYFQSGNLTSWITHYCVTPFFFHIYPNINQHIKGKYSQELVSTSDQVLNTTKMDFYSTTHSVGSYFQSGNRTSWITHDGLKLFCVHIYSNINQHIRGKYSKEHVSTSDQVLNTTKIDFIAPHTVLVHTFSLQMEHSGLHMTI